MNASLTIVARLLLALIFVVAGFGKLTGLQGTAGFIASKGLPLPMLLALAAALLEIGAGLALALGFRARIAAGALAAFTLLATLIFHDFWAAPADQAYVQQLMFMKNLAIVGGLLLVTAMGAGAASLDARRVAAD